MALTTDVHHCAKLICLLSRTAACRTPAIPSRRSTALTILEQKLASLAAVMHNKVLASALGLLTQPLDIDIICGMQLRIGKHLCRKWQQQCMQQEQQRLLGRKMSVLIQRTVAVKMPYCGCFRLRH